MYVATSLRRRAGGSATGLVAEDGGQRVPDGHRDSATLHHPPLALPLHPETSRRSHHVLEDVPDQERSPVVGANAPRGGRRLQEKQLKS